MLCTQFPNCTLNKYKLTSDDVMIQHARKGCMRGFGLAGIKDTDDAKSLANDIVKHDKVQRKYLLSGSMKTRKWSYLTHTINNNNCLGRKPCNFSTLW